MNNWAQSNWLLKNVLVRNGLIAICDVGEANV